MIIPTGDNKDDLYFNYYDYEIEEILNNLYSNLNLKKLKVKEKKNINTEETMETQE